MGTAMVWEKQQVLRSQDFVWGALFFLKKVDDLFCSSPSKDSLKLLNQPLPPPNLQKNVLKLTLALPGGALGVLGVHLPIFPVNYA